MQRLRVIMKSRQGSCDAGGSIGHRGVEKSGGGTKAGILLCLNEQVM